MHAHHHHRRRHRRPRRRVQGPPRRRRRARCHLHARREDDRLGGKIWTDIAEDPDGGRYIADGGSDSFLTDKTAVHRVARLLGIFERECGTLDETKKTFIVKNGRLVEMPDGMMMFAPTKLMPLATSKLYSWPAKFRMALDMVIPRKVRWAEGETAQQHDETLESLVVRRLGREALDRLAEPLAAGVNGDIASEMSVAARYPMLLDMEQKHGSLVRGFLAQRKKVEEMRKKYPPKPGAKRRTMFSSFDDGLQVVCDAHGRCRRARAHPHGCGRDRARARGRRLARDARRPASRSRPTP